MTPEQFAYWLQGFAELNPNTPPNATQWKQIQDHLNLVFKKVTPQPYPLGPGITAPITGPYMPSSPLNPWTSPGGIPPVITCSVSAPGAGTNWSSGAGSYDYMITSTQYSNKKNNVRLKL